MKSTHVCEPGEAVSARDVVVRYDDFVALMGATFTVHFGEALGIVGPNGSGKSNTIDALLFVFGYRASKMRQGKLSELIHNSDRHPDLQECSVEVHFREIIDLVTSTRHSAFSSFDCFLSLVRTHLNLFLILTLLLRTKHSRTIQAATPLTGKKGPYVYWAF